MSVDKKFYRIIDANLNRLREGLRVCEEVARFILDSKSLTLDFKCLRHDIKNILKCFPGDLRKNLINFRDSNSDVGRPTSLIENKRKDIKDIFTANMQRVKESVRVLEEFSKLIIKGRLSSKFKELRYRIYTLEKKTLARF